MSEGRESKWTQEELSRATRTAQEIWMHDPPPAFIEFVAQHNSLLDALMEVLPEGWADDDTMEHMPGVKTARRALANLV